MVAEVVFCLLCIAGEMQTTSTSTLDRSSPAANKVSQNVMKGSVTCPPDRPLSIPLKNRSVCVSSCGQGMVVDGSKCINVSECTKPVLSNGHCMDRCPEGYVYVKYGDYNFCGDQYTTCSYTDDDIKQTPCQLHVYLVARLVVFVVLTVLYILFIAVFFSTRKFPTTKLMKCFRCMRHTNNSFDDDKLLTNDDDND